MKLNDTREHILDAATRVVNRVGFSKATIDAIAEEAAMSKGGVFYYFKNKDECMLAIVERVFERILGDANALYRELPPGPGRMLKAYIMSWVKWQEPPGNVQIKGLLDNEILCARLADIRQEHYELVLDGRISLMVVQKVLLICNGLWTTPLLAKATPQELYAFFELMRDEMLRMIDESAAAGEATEQRGVVGQ